MPSICSYLLIDCCFCLRSCLPFRFQFLCGFFSMFEQVIPSFSCPVDSCQVPSSRCCCHAFLMYGQAIHFQPSQAPTPSVAPGPHFLSSLTTRCPQYSVGKNNHSCFVFFFHQLFARCRTRITIKETFC